MPGLTKIEWTETTWNPVTGCDKVSPGCKNCYAERMAKRLKAMDNPRYRNEFQVTLHNDLVGLPLCWSKPRKIFVNSMSDLFHEAVPLNFIQAVFETMNRASQHNFQVLTKRSERLREISAELTWTDNIWMGVSVELEDYAVRIDDLRTTGAAIKFLSLEPLLGSLKRVLLAGMDWVIVGGESGPGSRPMEKIWVREIRDKCDDQDIPFFFKQWGGFHKKKNGRTLDDRIHDDFPLAPVISLPSTELASV
ncbi:MAG: phage Gp37/Gp68 family protein [Candidatus Neomarinimicrobiota bacterium]